MSIKNENGNFAKPMLAVVIIFTIMKKIISGLLLVLLFLFFIVKLFKPFYDEIIENGWKGFFVALIAYIILGVLFWLIIKIFNWCLSVWE